MSVNFNKPPWYQGAKYLNDVNDSVVGGSISTLPSGVGATKGEQTLPGDRIILDAATAAALSDSTVGTLHGGVYMYVLATYTTAAAALGKAAFWSALSGTVLETAYQVSSDAVPSTAVPTRFAGVFINAITKNYYGWIQISGLATCLFDSALTATADGNWVSVKVSAAVASTFDCGAVAGVVTLAANVGVAEGAPSTSTASLVHITRGFGRW